MDKKIIIAIIIILLVIIGIYLYLGSNTPINNTYPPTPVNQTINSSNVSGILI